MQDPIRPDDSPDFEEGVLDAPVVTKQAGPAASMWLHYISPTSHLHEKQTILTTGTSGNSGCIRAQVCVSQDVLAADALILGAPGRQGGMCGEMRMFLDSLADLQSARGLQVSSLGASGRFCLLICSSSCVGCHFHSSRAGQSWRCVHECRRKAARLRGP